MSFSTEATGVATHAAKAFFARKFPATAKYNFYDPEVKRYLSRYSFWKGLSLVILFVFLFGLPVVYGWLLHGMYASCYELFLPEGTVFIPATWASFMIPDILLTLMTVGYAVEAVQKLLFEERYPVYEAYYNQEQGYDNGAATRWIAKIMMVPMVIALIAASAQYVTVDKEGFTYKDMFQFRADRFLFTEVSGIDYLKGLPAEKKGIFVDDSYRVRISGRDSIGMGPYFEDYEAMLPLIYAIRAGTGLPVDTIPLKY